MEGKNKKRSETINRILVFLIFGPIVLFFLFSDFIFDGILFTVLILFSSILGAIEILNIANQKGIKVYKVISVISVALIIIFVFITHYVTKHNLSEKFPDIIRIFVFESNFEFYVLIISTMLIFTIEIFNNDFKKSIETISVNSFTILYVGIMFSYALKIKYFYENGSFIILLLLAIIWMNDAGAYFIGKYFGKHKLSLSVSPNKTIEGYIGGILFGVIGSIIFYIIFKEKYSDIILFRFPYILLTSFFLSLIGNLGDLAESVLKRSSGVKDSHSFFPGHGGMLDVFDSMIYSAPILYGLLNIFSL